MDQSDIDTLPESIRDWNEVTESKDLTSFWDQMKNIRSKVGSGLYSPSEDAGDDSWNKFLNKAVDLSSGKLIPRPNFDDPEKNQEFYESLGKPKNKKDYIFEEIEGSEISDARKEFIQDIAFKANLSNNQLKELDSALRKSDVEFNTVQQSSILEGIKDLNSEWGMAAEDRTNEAKKAARIFFPHLGENPTLSADEIKSFYNLAKQLGDNNPEFKDQHNGGAQKMTPEEAMTAAQEMRDNKDHPFNNPMSAGHKQAREKMRSYYLIRNSMNA